MYVRLIADQIPAPPCSLCRNQLPGQRKTTDISKQMQTNTVSISKYKPSLAKLRSGSNLDQELRQAGDVSTVPRLWPWPCLMQIVMHSSGVVEVKTRLYIAPLQKAFFKMLRCVLSKNTFTERLLRYQSTSTWNNKNLIFNILDMFVVLNTNFVQKSLVYRHRISALFTQLHVKVWPINFF